MFDGRDYIEARPVRKLAYHARNVLTGPAISANLRNAYFVARHHNRGMGAQAWPRQMINPHGGWSNPAETLTDTAYRLVHLDRRRVSAHYTHAVAHVCFSIVDFTAQQARIRYSAGPDELTQPNSIIATADLSAGNGVQNGLLNPGGESTPSQQPVFSFEALLKLSLAGLALPELVTFELAAYAFHEDQPSVQVASAINATTYTITIAGIAHSYHSSGAATLGEIRDGLIAQLLDSGISASVVSADTLSISADGNPTVAVGAHLNLSHVVHPSTMRFDAASTWLEVVG